MNYQKWDAMCRLQRYPGIDSKQELESMPPTWGEETDPRIFSQHRLPRVEHRPKARVTHQAPPSIAGNKLTMLQAIPKRQLLEARIFLVVAAVRA